MKKTELIEAIAESADVPKSQAQKHFDAFEQVVTEALKRRGGADYGLREVLRKGAEGSGRQEPADGGENADSGREGSHFQRGQLPQGVHLRTASLKEDAPSGRLGK